MKDENIAMTASPKETDYRFKILYAFGIIMVCSGHVGGGGGGFTIVRNLFPYYGYHLALFVFCSGYFYKHVAEEHIWKYITKKINNLVLPLYILLRRLNIEDFYINLR